MSAVYQPPGGGEPIVLTDDEARALRALLKAFPGSTLADDRAGRSVAGSS